MASHYPSTTDKPTLRIVPSKDFPENGRRKRGFPNDEDNNVEYFIKRQNLAADDQHGKHSAAPGAQVLAGHGHAATRLPSPIESEFFDEAFCDEKFKEFSPAASKAPIEDAAYDVREFDKFGDTLLPEPFTVFPTPTENRPPSSVLRELDNESASNSTVDFDSALQHSPFPSKSLITAPYDELPSTNQTDVIWDQVRQHNASNRTVTTSPLTAEVKQPPSKKRGHIATQNHAPTNGNFVDGMMLKPGKFWFHFHEMLEAMESTYHNQPNVSFELFARVVYSTRENFEKKQYFWIRDLFKVQPPYISGVLAN